MGSFGKYLPFFFAGVQCTNCTVARGGHESYQGFKDRAHIPTRGPRFAVKTSNGQTNLGIDFESAILVQEQNVRWLEGIICRGRKAKQKRANVTQEIPTKDAE